MKKLWIICLLSIVGLPLVEQNIVYSNLIYWLMMAIQ